MSELDDFWIQIMQFVARHGDAEEFPTDANGQHPVVVALGDEPIVLLQQRIAAVGGNATIFVRDTIEGEVVVHVASAIDSDCAIGLDAADDLVIPGDALSTVSMFLNHLRNQPNGVSLGTQSEGPRFENIREVELAGA